ncbi:MAG: hypothetical protein WD250_09485 [Egibacteraceae bacterium]
MAVDDLARHRRLEQRLVEVLGPEEAATLLEQLPRGHHATKDDLDAGEGRLGGRMDGLDQRMDGLDQRMDGLGQRMVEFRDRLVERIDAQAAATQVRMEGVEGRMEGVEGRMEGVEGRLTAVLHQELGAVRTDMAGQTRTFVLSQLGMLATLAALAFIALGIV